MVTKKVILRGGGEEINQFCKNKKNKNKKSEILIVGYIFKIFIILFCVLNRNHLPLVV